jgi:hypothetical protein
MKLRLNDNAPVFPFVVTAKIETSFALEQNDPLGPFDDGGPRGTKPRRLSDVYFIDVARSGGP